MASSAASVSTFLQRLRREEHDPARRRPLPLAAAATVPAPAPVASAAGAGAAAASPVQTLEALVRSRREAAAASGGKEPDSEYKREQCKLKYFMNPELSGERYTPLWQLVQMPSSMWPGGHALYIMGGLGKGSCFYDSICYLLNVDGYADAALRHDEPRLIEIVERFRCAFMRNMSTSEWRQFLRSELAETPMSSSWRDVVEQRMSDTHEDLHEDFCRYDNWATEATARYLARRLHLTIYVINTSTWKAFCGVHGVDESDPVVLIAWERSTHFSPIVMATGVSGGGGDDDDLRVHLTGVITDPVVKARLRHEYETRWCNCDDPRSACNRPVTASVA